MGRRLPWVVLAGILWALPGHGASSAVSTISGDSSAIANTATETAFSTGSVTISANTLRAGDILRVRASGRFSTTVAPTMQCNLRWVSVNTNPIIVCTSVITDPVSGAVNEQWDFEALFICRSTGATGTVDGTGSVFMPTTS